MTKMAVITAIEFAGSIVLVFLCARVTVARSVDSRRKRVLQLASYIIATHLVIGLTQKDAWPITNYRLMHGLAPPTGELSLFGLYGVDANGREWRIDPYAWRSISHWHLHFWLWLNFVGHPQPEQEQQRAMAWLFGMAEAQRAQLASGHRSISPLGPFSAPEWWLYERKTAVPAEPYRALRLYLEGFTVAGAIAEAQQPQKLPDHIDRKLVSEWKSR